LLAIELALVGDFELNGGFKPTGNTSGSTSSKSLNPGRKYGKQDATNTENFFCNFYRVKTTRGVFQLKQHLVSGHRNTLACQKAPEHVKKEIRDYMDLKTRVKKLMICLNACHKAILMKRMMMMTMLRCLRMENSQVVGQKAVIACLQRDQ